MRLNRHRCQMDSQGNTYHRIKVANEKCRKDEKEKDRKMSLVW
jgi:hypothetical protein